MPYSRVSDILIHVFAVLAFMSLPLLFMSSQAGDGGSMAIIGSLGYWFFCLTYIIIFYLNTYVLVPRLYFNKRYLVYAAIVLIVFALVLLAQPFDHLMQQQQAGRMPEPPHEPGPFMPEPGMHDHPGGPPPERPGKGPRSMRIDIVSIILYVMTIALGMAIQVARQWRVTRQQVAKAEADKVQAELSFLKAQINPHFLFNTLNNIYTLAVTKNDQTADSIMKLSNIMRYITDDASHDFVSLQQEVNCIEDFIELQRLRLNKKSQIDYNVEGMLENKSIAPLLLMTFVENLFKYGISNHESSISTIEISATQNKIRFYSRNKIFQPAGPTNRMGVGIANAQKRLEHLYPGKHWLTISNENGYFTVELILAT